MDFFRSDLKLLCGKAVMIVGGEVPHRGNTHIHSWSTMVMMPCPFFTPFWLLK